MSKALKASVEGGKVKVGALSIAAAEIFSEALGPSEGIVFLDEGKAYYFPKSSGDLKSTLTQLITALEKTADAITKASTTFTSIGAGMTGPTTTPPPTLAVDVAALVTYATAITAAKTELETLKGALK